MKKQLHLKIPEPCHEDWNTMTPVEKGRFCDSCQKQVVDFTGMSDEQVFAFFRKPATGSVCGRFMNDQLDRDILMPRKRVPWLKYFFQFTIPVFLTSLKTTAQGQVVLKRSTNEVCSKEVMGNSRMLNQPKLVGDTIIIPGQKENISLEPLLTGKVGMVTSSVLKQIQGRVVDENGMGIPYSSIFIKGTKTGTVCDSVGYFKLRMLQRQSEIILVASSVGYSTVEKNIELATNSLSNIIMSSTTALSGEVVIVGAISNAIKGRMVGAVSVVKKEPIYQRFQKWIGIKQDSANVYPNPVMRSHSVRIEFASSQNQKLRVKLFTLDGKMVDEKYFEAVKGQSIFQLQVDSRLTAGIYLLQIIDETGRLIKKEKLIVN